MDLVRALRERRRPAMPGATRVVGIVPAVASFAASFGVVAEATGVALGPAVVMSATTFAGAAQLGAVTVLASGGTAAAAIATAALLNGRYLPMGVAVAGTIDGPAWQRVLEAQLIVDESWALSRRRDGGHDRAVLRLSGAALYVVWVGGTTAGHLGAGSVGDPASWGFDAGVAALFAALLIPQLTSRPARSAALLAAVVTLALTPASPAGVPVMGASAAAAVGLWR